LGREKTTEVRTFFLDFETPAWATFLTLEAFSTATFLDLTTVCLAPVGFFTSFLAGAAFPVSFLAGAAGFLAAATLVSFFGASFLTGASFFGAASFLAGASFFGAASFLDGCCLSARIFYFLFNFNFQFFNFNLIKCSVKCIFAELRVFFFDINCLITGLRYTWSEYNIICPLNPPSNYKFFSLLKRREIKRIQKENEYN